MGHSHQPLRILSHQQVIRAGQPLPSSVSFVGCFSLGLKNICYCMCRGGCSFSSGTSYWYGVFTFQLTICLLRERSGHLPLSSAAVFIWLCYLHPLYKLSGEGVLFVLGVGIPTSQSCFMYLLFKLSFGIKNYASLKLTSRGSTVNFKAQNSV